MHSTHSSFSAKALFFALAALAAAACAPAAPANPTWEDDVKPILAANCVRCHRSPAVNGAPTNFRLDICEEAGGVLGASDQVVRILARGTSPGNLAMPPPPAAPLSDRQIEIIQNWQVNGTPCTGAAAASFVLLRAAEESVGVSAGEQRLVLSYTLEDPAGTLAGATAVAVSASGDTHVAPEPLRAGTAELVWPVNELAPGTYELLVTLDDGSEIREVRAGTFTVAR